MRIVFNNSALVFAKSVWSAKGKIIKVGSNEVSKVSLPINAKVYSRNLVDATKGKWHTILNDNGVEVSDNSSYFDQFIPAVAGATLLTNESFARVYLYDENKNLLNRKILGTVTSTEVPSEYNGTPVKWIKLQTGGLTEARLSTMIVVMNEPSAPTSYEAYQSNADGTIYSPYSWVWADDLSEIEITAQ